VNLHAPERCTLIPVISAADMHSATMKACGDADILIAAAAVADYRPVTVATQKIKKHADAMHLELEKNVDIVSAAASEYSDLFVVGFAAETQNIEEYARGKLERKNLDAIVANDVSRSDVGFNSDDNEAWWINANTSKTFSIRSKTQLARDIVAAIAEQLG
jgi:phosphopantothenoylcysteine decarboxylase/phosphopantothenate--cysteine ligase